MAERRSRQQDRKTGEVWRSDGPCPYHPQDEVIIVLEDQPDTRCAVPRSYWADARRWKKPDRRPQPPRQRVADSIPDDQSF
jgi:hypothetical protein